MVQNIASSPSDLNLEWKEIPLDSKQIPSTAHWEEISLSDNMFAQWHFPVGKAVAEKNPNSPDRASTPMEQMEPQLPSKAGLQTDQIKHPVASWEEVVFDTELEASLPVPETARETAVAFSNEAHLEQEDLDPEKQAQNDILDLSAPIPPESKDMLSTDSDILDLQNPITQGVDSDSGTDSDVFDLSECIMPEAIEPESTEDNPKSIDPVSLLKPIGAKITETKLTGTELRNIMSGLIPNTLRAYNRRPPRAQSSQSETEAERMVDADKATLTEDSESDTAPDSVKTELAKTELAKTELAKTELDVRVAEKTKNNVDLPPVEILTSLEDEDSDKTVEIHEDEPIMDPETDEISDFLQILPNKNQLWDAIDTELEQAANDHAYESLVMLTQTEAKPKRRFLDPKASKELSQAFGEEWQTFPMDPKASEDTPDHDWEAFVLDSPSSMPSSRAARAHPDLSQPNTPDKQPIPTRLKNRRIHDSSESHKAQTWPKNWISYSIVGLFFGGLLLFSVRFLLVEGSSSFHYLSF